MLTNTAITGPRPACTPTAIHIAEMPPAGRGHGHGPRILTGPDLAAVTGIAAPASPPTPATRPPCRVSITRCCDNYGPYQYPEKVIPLFVTNLMEGKPVPLYGDGLNVRGWIHVDDHCRGIQLVLERGECGRIYHINGDIELTNRELTVAILEACGADWDMVMMVEDRKGHDRAIRWMTP